MMNIIGSRLGVFTLMAEDVRLMSCDAHCIRFFILEQGPVIQRRNSTEESELETRLTIRLVMDHACQHRERQQKNSRERAG
jgi:hypothetical protein